jgi:hypothetical protein
LTGEMASSPQPIFWPAVIVAKPATAVSMRSKRALISLCTSNWMSYLHRACAPAQTFPLR